MSGLLLAQVANSRFLNNLSTFDLVIIGVTLYSIVAAITQAMKSVLLGRQENALKREMLDRGFSAEDIVRVISARTDEDEEKEEKVVTNLPCASQVVVEKGVDWCSALVMQVSDTKYFVHYTGSDPDDEDEWVGADRIRFPADSKLPSLAAQLSTGRNANGLHEKGPIEAEV